MVGSTLEDEDAALFNEFYSRIVSRDIAIKNILDVIHVPYKKREELRKTFQKGMHSKITLPREFTLKGPSPTELYPTLMESYQKKIMIES